MDDNLNPEAVRSSTLQIFQDAFAPQPHRRTKAWERAAVEAHAPRLRGQKIWKKAGLKAPQDDKENFETAMAELENGGIGARKKRRIMGAKENISDAQWQLIEEGGFTNANAVLSPKKKGRNSLMADTAGALLVPRKRTNANHLITPRKPLRKTSNDNNLGTVFESSSGKEPARKDMEENIVKKCVDGTNKLLFSDSEKTTDTIEGLSEKPERRRKSLRRSTRRLTQSDIQAAQDEAPAAECPSTSLSLIVWSAPVFDIFQNAQGISEPEAQAVENNVSNSAQEMGSNLMAVEAGVSSTNDDSASSLGKLQLSSDESLENASGEDSVQVSLDIKEHEPIFGAASLEVSRRNLHPHDFTSASQKMTATTPDRTIDIEKPILDSMNDHQAVTSTTSTRTMTPKSKRNTSRVGSRRSTRTPRAKSFTPLSTAQSADEAAMSETSPTNDAASPLKPYGLEGLPTEPELEPSAVHCKIDLAALEPAEAGIATETAAISGDEHFNPCAAEFTEKDSKSEADKEPASPVSTSAKDVITDVEAAPDFIVLPLDSTSLSGFQTDNNGMDHEASVISQPEVASVAAATAAIAEITTISLGMDHIVNLFPAFQSDKSDSHAARTEAISPSEQAVEENVMPKVVSVRSTEQINDPGQYEQQEIDETISILATTSGIKSGEVQEIEPRPLVDHDDTDLLRDFVTRVKASRAAKAVNSIPKRKRSLPHSPLRLPLGDEVNSSPSGADTKDDEFDVSELAPSPNKRRKHNNPLPEEDELAEPVSTRRSNRTRLPVKKSLAAPSFIPVRRLGQDGDNTVTLRRSEDKELAALTRMNTRKNKGAAVHPAKVMAKKAEEKDDPASRQRALKEVFDQKKKESKKGKTVVWAEELAQFQTVEGKKEVLQQEVEKAKVVEEKKTAVKVGMRSKMSLGMAVNGTPAPKRKVRGRS